MAEILTQLFAKNSKNWNRLLDCNDKDKIFSESGNVKENVCVSSLDISVICCILQMNVSVFPARSAKYRRKALKKCIGINYRETCCDIAAHIDNNMCKCNVSKSSCYIDNTTCCNDCKSCPNWSKSNPCKHTKLRKSIEYIRKKSINCEAVDKNLLSQIQRVSLIVKNTKPWFTKLRILFIAIKMN